MYCPSDSDPILALVELFTPALHKTEENVRRRNINTRCRGQLRFPDRQHNKISRIRFAQNGQRECVNDYHNLRTFVPNFSNIDFFQKILPLKDHELAMSEM